MKCLNCGEEGPHFVPPSLGEPGFYTCKKKEAAMMSEKDTIIPLVRACADELDSPALHMVADEIERLRVADSAKSKYIKELRAENKRVNDLCQDFNAQLLEERLQKTCEYAQTNDQLRERIAELEANDLVESQLKEIQSLNERIEELERLNETLTLDRGVFRIGGEDE